MICETAVFQIANVDQYGRAAVYFSRRADNSWAVSLTIGKLTVKIPNDKKRDALRPCPTHSMQILKLHLARAEQARPKSTVLK